MLNRLFDNNSTNDNSFGATETLLTTVVLTGVGALALGFGLHCFFKRRYQAEQNAILAPETTTEKTPLAQSSGFSSSGAGTDDMNIEAIRKGLAKGGR